MTKAQMAERIAELEKEVEALRAGASVETHIHYHYPQPAQPTFVPSNTPGTWWPYQPNYPYITCSNGDVSPNSGVDWGTTL